MAFLYLELFKWCKDTAMALARAFVNSKQYLRANNSYHSISLTRFICPHKVFQHAAEEYNDNGLFRAGTHLFVEIIILIPDIWRCNSWLGIANLINKKLGHHATPIKVELFLFMKRNRLIERFGESFSRLAIAQ